MGKLKEKLKPEKLSATFPAYILAYFMCMMTGFCMIMFLRELRYQIGILQRYGLGELGNVASALLFGRAWKCSICVIVCSCMCIFLLSWCKDYYLPCSQKGPERIKASKWALWHAN